MWAFAFVLLGFLVGNLAGLTTAAVTLPLIAALFAFAGSSAIALSERISDAHRPAAAKAIAGLAVGCLVGVYLGIAVREHEWLSPQPRGAVSAGAPTPATSRAANAYLRGELVPMVNLIEQDRQAGRLRTEQAYDSLLALIRRSTSTGGE